MKVYVLLLYSTRWAPNLNVFDSLEEAIKAREEAYKTWGVSKNNHNMSFKIQEMELNSKFTDVCQQRIFVDVE